MRALSRSAVLPVWMAITAIGTACDEPCNLQDELRARAGAAAIDCGHVPLGGDRSATDACVIQAFMDERAFTARYALHGTDSSVALGVVGTAAGAVTLLLYDGDPGGGGGDDHPVISGNICEGARPRSAPLGPNDAPLDCDVTRPLGRICE